ncbi:hypothetical protein TNCV_3312001 [Trichonephila clavipes]|nr:hypothetical protein TNCV_3312001 [Trichonephila clavipes]
MRIPPLQILVNISQPEPDGPFGPGSFDPSVSALPVVIISCAHSVTLLRVQYFVRGGSVGHRSRASSRHLSPHLPVDELDSSGGSNRGCAAPADARVGVGSTKKAD